MKSILELYHQKNEKMNRLERVLLNAMCKVFLFIGLLCRNCDIMKFLCSMFYVRFGVIFRNGFCRIRKLKHEGVLQ